MTALMPIPDCSATIWPVSGAAFRNPPESWSPRDPLRQGKSGEASSATETLTEKNLPDVVVVIVVVVAIVVVVVVVVVVAIVVVKTPATSVIGSNLGTGVAEDALRVLASTRALSVSRHCGRLASPPYVAAPLGQTIHSDDANQHEQLDSAMVEPIDGDQR